MAKPRKFDVAEQAADTEPMPPAANTPARVRILADATYWIQTPTGAEITRQWYRGQIIADDSDVIAELQANGVHLEPLE